MLNSMCKGDSFLILEDLAEKIIYWETARDDSLSSRLARRGMHAVFDVSHLEFKIVVFGNILKALSIFQPQNLKLL